MPAKTVPGGFVDRERGRGAPARMSAAALLKNMSLSLQYVSRSFLFEPAHRRDVPDVTGTTYARG